MINYFNLVCYSQLAIIYIIKDIIMLLYNSTLNNLLFLNKILIKYPIKLMALALLFLSSYALAKTPLDIRCSGFNNSASELAKMNPDKQEENKDTVDSVTSKDKAKCNANFLRGPMIASWPDMQVLNLTEYEEKSNKVDILVIQVIALKEILTDVTSVRDYYLTKVGVKDKEVSSTTYIDRLGLYFATVTMKSPQYTLGHYWQEIDSRVPIVINCVWNEIHKTYALCSGFFIMQELGAMVDVTFTPEKLSQWKEIAKHTEQHIIYRIKNRI